MLYITCLDYRRGVFSWHPGLRIWGLGVVGKEPRVFCARLEDVQERLGGAAGERLHLPQVMKVTGLVWPLWDLVDGATPPQVCWSLLWWASESPGVLTWV